MIAPIYASLAETYPAVAFGKIDIDDNQVREDKKFVHDYKAEIWKSNAYIKHSIKYFLFDNIIFSGVGDRL
jgi:hypothetical protein